MTTTKIKIIAISLPLSCLLIYGLTVLHDNFENLQNKYQAGRSQIISDRNGKIIKIMPNNKGYYSIYSDKVPERYQELLLKKEDRFFFYHPGINPASVLRAAWLKITGNKRPASSTITQQLVKILLGQENKRNIKNKISETFYTFSLELFSSKEKILTMYANLTYFGNKAQGLNEASRLYFNKDQKLLNDDEILRLLVTINNPSNNNPFLSSNLESANILAERLSVNKLESAELTTESVKEKMNSWQKWHENQTNFELSSFNLNCLANCPLTVDSDLTENVRSIVARNLSNLADKNTTNAAVVVLKQPENQILAIVGSPDPGVDAYGYKINMAVSPRSIGSTFKPFIYMEGFRKGLRPYTRVVDKEYKYTISDNFAFYPKNYDYKYRGEVSLHYALSNSLNVPTVKVLDYVGIKDFNDFLENKLNFKAEQNIGNYQLSLALGGLEMDLLSLSYYFSALSNNGWLKPLQISPSLPINIKVNANLGQNKKISDPKYIELINKILSDRLTGIEQFGLASSLNLDHSNYAVKTGTSKDFLDSWTVGYTPDFTVGVWVGNSDRQPMDSVSGAAGAGRIWHEVMDKLYNSSYNKNTNFNFASIKEYPDGNSIDYGLAGDNFASAKNLLSENILIQKPHDQDVFLLEKNSQIALESNENVIWRINEEKVGQGKEFIMKNLQSGVFTVKATANNKEESIKIYVKNAND